MSELQLQALIDHFDKRVKGRTAAVGLVSRAAGEEILRALLLTYLRQRYASVTRLIKCRPEVEVDKIRAVLDDAIVVTKNSGARELLSVEYKFWTASSYQGKKVPEAGIAVHAWASWHQELEEWRQDVDRDTFLAWKSGAKVLGKLDKSRLPADVAALDVRRFSPCGRQ
ncbi:hypothetical protein [Paractinoplanes lichenicola]|uniref:Uncharacterized protein n=1 Tax=Paractinoplanes lichenicola TaxID=2802976 RepID=A0ABS1VY12_9ACTN|nr:hypothetical protein [Actinoplanes lichenicola]MBL7259386.1 hypothetical protein [Actinoplanes lichenicola]